MYQSCHELGVQAPMPVPASRHLARHEGQVTSEQRQQRLRQRPATVWLTGLSGAGKSTLAYELEHRLHGLGLSSFVLDGDNLRHHLNRDLGFSGAERRENIRRVAEVAALMNQAGLVVFTALISPQRADRAMARAIIGEPHFIEVHVSTGLEVCEQRDPKGLYEKARAGLIPQFTGVSAPYEAPSAPDFRIDTAQHSLTDAATLMLDGLRQRGLLGIW